MASNQMEEKYEKKFNVELRGGTRGGKDQFSWETVKDMPYNHREMYLGVSSKIGVLDRGSKYRKKDFFNYYTKLDIGDKMREDRKKALREDERRMAAALGLEMPVYSDEQEGGQKDKELTKEEKDELQAKILGGREFNEGEGNMGIGFDKLKVKIRAKVELRKDNPHKIESIDEEQVEVKREEVQIEKREKKDKKQKKQKQEKKQKRRRLSSKSKSRQKGEISESKERSRSRRKQKKQKKQKRQNREKKERKYKRSQSRDLSRSPRRRSDSRERRRSRS